jgi:hypothetical protein
MICGTNRECVTSSSSAVSCPDTQVHITCSEAPYSTTATAQIILSNGTCTTSGKICGNVLNSCGTGVSSGRQYTKSGGACTLTP